MVLEAQAARELAIEFLKEFRVADGTELKSLFARKAPVFLRIDRSFRIEMEFVKRLNGDIGDFLKAFLMGAGAGADTADLD